MTITELHIQFDLQPENKISILKNNAFDLNKRYLFVDSSDGHCYLFDENGNEDDIKKIKYIGYAAFAHCKNLKSIVIPDSVKSIGDGAFYECKNLKSMKISDFVESIGYKAFAWCESLESIIIPDSVESIGYNAFYGCKSLKSIVIHDSVKRMRSYTFYGCENLKSVVFKGKTMKQVKEMNNYPFGIEDESIIKCC